MKNKKKKTENKISAYMRLAKKLEEISVKSELLKNENSVYKKLQK